MLTINKLYQDIGNFISSAAENYSSYRDSFQEQVLGKLLRLLDSKWQLLELAQAARYCTYWTWNLK